MVMPLDGSATATLSISGETIKKIDPKYLDLEWIPEMQGVGEEIVPTTTKLSGSGANTLPSEAAEKMTVGTNIVVYVKDKRYVCTISDINGNRMAGNLSMLLEGYPDTGEPFYIWIRDDGSQIIFETSDVWWYAIYAVGNSQQIPRKLPSEYVPDMSAFYVNALIGDFNAESGSDKNTANKTYSEIMAAYEMNRPVFCRVDGEIVLSLVHITDNTRDISFGGLYKGVERIVTFTSGGLIKTYYQRYAPAT